MKFDNAEMALFERLKAHKNYISSFLRENGFDRVKSNQIIEKWIRINASYSLFQSDSHRINSLKKYICDNIHIDQSECWSKESFLRKINYFK